MITITITNSIIVKPFSLFICHLRIFINNIYLEYCQYFFNLNAANFFQIKKPFLHPQVILQ
ncbi:MAG: hypothetical protein A2471_00940 [Omnitrophica WOR_2 bacterium RIFOXYC2_FULL_45_15]|nr:MAG: hypothetical protein A2471_00940 [Omnitrophica WOR_2 bacterium RIFOXYC2_FULL_45_15]